jgi:DNA helicase-2/ATP-dependent DNA helicase PcrA
VAYLRLVSNPVDNQSFRRIVNVPARGIGAASVVKLDEEAAGREVSLLQACTLPDVHAEFPARTRQALQQFAALIQDLHTQADQIGIPECIRTVLGRTGYRQVWSAEGTKEGQDRLDNLEELVASAQEFQAEHPKATLAGFLDTVSLMSDVDEKRDGTHVTLMTLHAAKGLEFPLVFLTGLEDGILPHERALSEGIPGVEEERRLCYVGMTRAMEQLVLSCARTRKLYQRPTPKLPSRFLAEIPAEVLEITGGERAALIFPGAAADGTAAADPPPDRKRGARQTKRGAPAAPPRRKTKPKPPPRTSRRGAGPGDAPKSGRRRKPRGA